ncbi:hypothetical protein [Actinokineospora globicatena]|uniref:hypothetical protein n=1 Tax=Actinokineospora globicatena TaxID=103729 RepID=UPI0025565117|nr:hypothetical protein [Actinokineospora globicatena]
MLWRRRRVGVVVVAVLVAGVAPGVAAARVEVSEGPAVIKMRVGIDEGELDKMRAQARAGQKVGPQQQGRAPRTPGDDQRERQPAQKPAAAEKQARATAAAAERVTKRNPGAVTAAPPPPVLNEPNHRLLDECFKSPESAPGMGRIHNRFTHCQRIGVEAEYWTIRNGVPVEKEGTTTATLELFTQTDDKQRRARQWARIQRDSVDYDWGWWDNIWLAPNVPLTIIGQCRESFSVCAASGGGVTFPWAYWDNQTTWQSWDVYNKPGSGVGRDVISYNHEYVELFTDFPPFVTIKRGESPQRALRCDSATYFRHGTTTYPHACVFAEVTPRAGFTTDPASNYYLVSLHILQAQDAPNQTYPRLVPDGVPPPRDKRIPGKYIAGDENAPGLHRISPQLHPTEDKENDAHKNGACYGTGIYADLYRDIGLPVPPDTSIPEECDEYPMGSTLEGAAHPDWDFSVKAVPRSHNRAAGGKVRVYYVDDRILQWDYDLEDPFNSNDRFYVHVQ